MAENREYEVISSSENNKELADLLNRWNEAGYEPVATTTRPWVQESKIGEVHGYNLNQSYAYQEGVIILRRKKIFNAQTVEKELQNGKKHISGKIFQKERGGING